MANPEHVKRLNQGVEQWNKWRKQSPEIGPDLKDADLSSIDLKDANLRGANLNGAGLSGANLRRVSLNSANLYQARMRGANLRSAHLNGANLRGAHLSDADLSGADLSYANLSYAIFEGTTIAKSDLRTVKGLAKILHQGPSHIELFSIQLPQDGSALHFLQGVGVPNKWINDYRAHMIDPIRYHSLFISYSSQDDILAHRLYADLQAQGVRCWFAPEDMKIGNKIRDRIDEAVHVQDKSLLLLSEHAIASTWVEHEVEAILEKEDRQKREVLFPVRLDDSVMQTSKAWAATLRRTRHIGDFTNWANPQAYQRAFDRLLRDLKRADHD